MKLLFNGLVELNIDPAELRWAHFFHAEFIPIYIRVVKMLDGIQLKVELQVSRCATWKLYSNGTTSFETKDILFWNVHESEIDIYSNNIGKTEKEYSKKSSWYGL